MSSTEPADILQLCGKRKKNDDQILPFSVVQKICFIFTVSVAENSSL